MANDFDTALVECFSHLRDVSLRDGIQCWDGNKWPIGNILPAVQELDLLHTMVQKRDGKMAPVEVWGGGQFAQPAKFLKEDPFVNLEKLRAAAPHLDLQMLYRGRQGLGFTPISKEVQKAALEASVKRGINVIRIFDMMNDMENLKTGIQSMVALKKVHHDRPFLIEGAISYISEPEGGKRAWTLDEYGDLAVKMAKAGCDEIAIKNYAGVGDWEMPELVRVLRAKLADAGYPAMKVNLHTHGQKPDVLLEAIKAGADKVDVAFGKLSGGPSHSDAMETLKRMLKEKGFDVDGDYKSQFDNHDIVKQMRVIEHVIGVQGKSLLRDRGKPLSQEQMDKYRMAGGAFGDLWKNYIKDNAEFKRYVESWKTSREKLRSAAVQIDNPAERKNIIASLKADEYGALPNIPKNKQEWRDEVLALSTQLWEKAGRFNTVTPGAFILCWQAVLLTDKRLAGKEIAMTDYTQQYIDVIIGRYGKNQGIEKGIGDLKFRDAALMFRALKSLNEAIAVGKATKEETSFFFSHALPGITLDPKGMVKLDDPRLKERLERTDIRDFQSADNFKTLPKEVCETMQREMTPGRSPDPTEGLETGRKLLRGTYGSMQEKRVIFSPENRISQDENDTALLAMLLRANKPTGEIDDSIAKNLFMAQKSAAIARETKIAAGDAAEQAKFEQLPNIVPPDVPAPKELVRKSKDTAPTAADVGRRLLFATRTTPGFPDKGRLPN